MRGALAAVVVAALAAGSPAPPGDSAAVAPRQATRVGIPGSHLALGMSLARVDSLVAYHAPRGTPGPAQRTGPASFFGLPGQALLEFDQRHVVRATFTVEEVSRHSRDYVEDQLRHAGMRSECQTLADTLHDCVWHGRVVMHLTWKPELMTAEVEPAPLPGAPDTVAAVATPLPPAPMYPETLYFSTRAAPDAMWRLRDRIPEPVYPVTGRVAAVQGTVRVLATVDTTGNVIDTVVLHSIKELDDAAVGAARQYRFVPLVVAGRPVQFRIMIPFSFVLH